MYQHYTSSRLIPSYVWTVCGCVKGGAEHTQTEQGVGQGRRSAGMLPIKDWKK